MCDENYRPYGVPYSKTEMPILLTRPIGYIYVCEKCGKRFESHYMIHIPWCGECRLRDLNMMIAEVRAKKKDKPGFPALTSGDYPMYDEEENDEDN